MQASLIINEIAHPLRLKILCMLGDAVISMRDVVGEVEAPQRYLLSVHCCSAWQGCVSRTQEYHRASRFGRPAHAHPEGMIRDDFVPASFVCASEG